jgi:hypothetical protein
MSRSKRSNQREPSGGSGEKLYIVRWRQQPYEKAHAHRTGPAPLPRLLHAFTDREEARHFCEDLECGRRPPPADLNPFLQLDNPKQAIEYLEAWGSAYNRSWQVTALTSFDEPVLHDWVLDTGLTPPEPQTVPSNKKGQPPYVFRDWFSWWEANVAEMTDLQRARIRQALDKVSFFEVIETELEA